jgi:hypothetical protein
VGVMQMGYVLQMESETMRMRLLVVSEAEEILMERKYGETLQMRWRRYANGIRFANGKTNTPKIRVSV